MALRRSCHPTQLASQLSAHLTAQPASQQCTQMPRNGVERPLSPICVHYCVPTGRPRGSRIATRAATVYTNAPERRRKTVFGDLCTLLHPHPAARATPAAQQCTQMPQNGVERPFSPICVHYCVPTGRSRESRVATVYTNGLERRRKAVFGDLCTLLRPPASPSAARESPALRQCTQMAQNGVERTFSAICVHYCIPTGRPRDPRAATVYTNAPERRREAVFGDLCTLLRPPASPRAARAGLAAQQCTQSRSP